jgi:hypothetical protein
MKRGCNWAHQSGGARAKSAARKRHLVGRRASLCPAGPRDVEIGPQLVTVAAGRSITHCAERARLQGDVGAAWKR